MLTDVYIEALLVDKELADQVWETWNDGEMDNVVAYICWMMIFGADSIRGSD